MRRLLVSSFVVGVGLVVVPGCYGATEIVVSVQTDVPCATVRTTGIAIRATGASSTLSDASVVATSTTCTDGAAGALNELGSLVLVPSSNTPQISVRVVLGVERPTDTCDPTTSAGCIIADRRITYEKHTTLRLPIRLDDACLGRVCATGQTCSAGLCVSSIAACSGASCASVETDDAGAPPVVTVEPDGGLGVVDAGPIVPDAAVCPPLPNTGCGCGERTQFCCFTPRGGSCVASQTACEKIGGTIPCTDDCQCAGKQCASTTKCSTDGSLVKVCGGTCDESQ